jgi:hypothetical protein
VALVPPGKGEGNMRNAARRTLVGLVAAGVLVVPAAAFGQTKENSSWMTSSSSRSYRPDTSRDDDRKVGRGLDVIGLTDKGRLVRFDASDPRRSRDLGRVKGLADGDSLVGIDYRVQNGLLYGVGLKGVIYTISTRSAVATMVGQLTVPLQGTSFGVDFNPAANRLRVISDTGQNLRHNLDDPMGAPPAGTTASDGTLTYPPATTPAAGVTGAAYTNNDLDATTATTLFDLDTMQDQVAVQSPANNGTLAPTGKLAVDAGPVAGLDIYSRIRGGRTQSNVAYAALQVGGRSVLFVPFCTCPDGSLAPKKGATVALRDTDEISTVHRAPAAGRRPAGAGAGGSGAGRAGGRGRQARRQALGQVLQGGGVRRLTVHARPGEQGAGGGGGAGAARRAWPGRGRPRLHR